MATTKARPTRARSKSTRTPTPAARTRAEMRRGLKVERDVRRLSFQIGAAIRKRDEALGDLFMVIAQRIGRAAAVQLLTRRFPGVVDSEARKPEPGPVARATSDGSIGTGEYREPKPETV